MIKSRQDATEQSLMCWQEMFHQVILFAEERDGLILRAVHRGYTDAFSKMQTGLAAKCRKEM